MRLILVSFSSWAIGVGAYVVCLYLFSGQTASSGDLRAVLFWSAFASAIAVALVYVPLMFALRKWTRGNAGVLTYASASVMAGVVPVLIITTIFGGNLRSLMTPEAFLFFCLFAAFGLVFGSGFSFAYGKRRSA
jgi:hypothetical protein